MFTVSTPVFFEFLGLLNGFFVCWKKLGFGGLGLGLGVAKVRLPKIYMIVNLSIELLNYIPSRSP